MLPDCTSHQILAPNNALVTIASEKSNCVEAFKKKQFFLLFGLIPLNKVTPSESIDTQESAYRFTHKATWSDVIITIFGAPSITLTAKTFIAEKCNSELIADYRKEFESKIVSNVKKAEETHLAELLKLREDIKNQKEKFEKDKESIIAVEIEKKKLEFEKEYEKKKNLHLDTIVKKRLEEIELQKLAFKQKIVQDREVSNSFDKKEIENQLRIQLEKEFQNKLESLKLEIKKRLEKDSEESIAKRLKDVETEFYKKKEKEVTLSLEKYFKTHPSLPEDPELATLILKKGKILHGKLIKFEADFVSIEQKGEVKKYFIREIVKVIFPKKK